MTTGHSHDHGDHGDHGHGQEGGGQLAAGGGVATDCSEALLRVYEYLDGEMSPADCVKIQAHLDDCAACLQQYHLDQALKAVVKRSCRAEAAPVELRATILQRLTMIRVTGSPE